MYSVCQPIVPYLKVSMQSTSTNPKCAYNLLKSTNPKVSLHLPSLWDSISQNVSLTPAFQSLSLAQKSLTTYYTVTSQGSRSPPTQKAPSPNRLYGSSYFICLKSLPPTQSLGIHLPKVPSTYPVSRHSSTKSPFHLPSL